MPTSLRALCQTAFQFSDFAALPRMLIFTNKSLSQELWFRFKVAGKKVVRGLRRESQDTTGILFNKPCHMPKEVLQFERRLISQALATANGRITHAAKWLGIGRQRLAYIIETRHPDLLKERSPVRRRPRKR